METEATPTTVYLEPALRQALELKAAETGYSISELVNEAVEAALVEDAEVNMSPERPPKMDRA